MSPSLCLVSQCSSKGSKSDAGITNIPSRINVPQKDVSEDPEVYVTFSFCYEDKRRNQLTAGQSLVRSRTSKTSTGVWGDWPEIE
jgi:hypothetical protein